MNLQPTTDPVTRYVHLTYGLPATVPELVSVRSEVRPLGSAEWQPAPVHPYVSATARSLLPEEEWLNGIRRGTLVERRAGGLARTLVWNPFHQFGGRAAVEMRISLLDGEEVLAREETLIELRNEDVVVLEDWRRVIQGQLVSENPGPGEAVWWYRRGQGGENAPSAGTALEAKEKGVELPPLTYPLDLRGPYAIFVSLPPGLSCIELRLSGDERIEDFGAGSHLQPEPVDPATRPGDEDFWRWVEMDRQHLVIAQPYRSVFEYEDEFRARLHRVRLVPLKGKQVERLEAEWGADGERRQVFGYQEPYSWGFTQKIESNLQLREPLLAFAEARVDSLDIQFARGGSCTVSETRVGTQLLGPTQGDPVRGEVPHTDNVGRLQQFTNTLGTQLEYARQLGVEARANLGATNCYVGTPFESEFSRQHPEWRQDSLLRYEVPEVRQYILALFEEALEIGARGLSIDWCRYPHSVKNKETVTGFLRQLRALAERYSDPQRGRVSVLVRFPVRGAPCCEHMDYTIWAQERLVDYLCPSNIFNRPLAFEIDEYLEAVRGTPTILLPNVEPCLPLPGMWFQRLLDCYEKGVEGVFIYQCDAPVSKSRTRRYVSIAGSVDALRRWRRREAGEQPRYSKGIYLSPPHKEGKYQPYERLRVWVEGVGADTVEIWVDGRRVNNYEAPPYIPFSEALEDDHAIGAGTHTLKVRARDGGGWIERDFQVQYA